MLIFRFFFRNHKRVFDLSQPDIQNMRHELRFTWRLIVFFVLLFLTSRIWAQEPCEISDQSPDFPGGRSSNLDRRPIPLPYVREADVMWSKRVWRTLDLREKMNHPYYYPETPHNGLMSLFDLVRTAVLQGCVTAFDNPVFDDEFKEKLSPEGVARLLEQTEIITVENPYNPGNYTTDTITTSISTSEITGWWIKEDWFFDKQRSVMDVRILGLCPLQSRKDPSTGEVVGVKPLFWIYFPQLRSLLLKQDVFLGDNFSAPLTYDDMFLKRMFSSYIHKESNVYYRSVSSYASGLEVQLEAEHIKEQIRNFESDLWHY